MDGHLALAVSAIDAQFGEGVGKNVIPADRPVVMNKVSALDAMYEIIVDGFVIGRLRFEIPDRKYTFILTLEGGRRVGEVSRQKWVTCDDGVLGFLKDGANLMVPGILGCDSDIEAGDQVWVINTDGATIAVGASRMSGTDIAREERGFAVKIREVGDPIPPRHNPARSSWDDVVRANSADIERMEEEAIAFIQNTVESMEGAIVVGFSGGKDSLAVYLLVEKALDIHPPLFFMNTGLEFPETVEYVRQFAAERNTAVIGHDAGDKFWESVRMFGPPARDFRWCCKVLKLGPAATTISEKLGTQTLSFMGQRRLESFNRSTEPPLTTNPGVPGQTTANPIQNRNALDVWLYIFKERAEFNPLYRQGYHRLGCYLCPASPLEEIERLRDTHPALYARWISQLRDYAQKQGFPPEWVDMGFWRWKHIPPGQMNLIRQLGLDVAPVRRSAKRDLELSIVKGVSPCVTSGFSVEGQFSQALDLSDVKELLSVFGETHLSEEMGALYIKRGQNSISLFSSGSIVVRGPDGKRVESLVEQIKRAVWRRLFCQGCGSCIPKCEYGALSLVHGRITVDPERCVNCLECDRWPCPTYLD